MKTFVADDYQVTLMDNGGVRVLIEDSIDKYIMYVPDAKKPWSKCGYNGYDLKKSNNIIDLDLSKWKLEILSKAFEVVGRRDLFDKEIAFINREEQ